MDRPWNIAEQVIEDPTTKLRLEFSSVHTDELAAGRPAPDHDQVLYLRLWTSDRLRVATYAFTRGGAFIKATVEPLDPQHAALPPGEGPIETYGLRDEGQLVESVGGFENINYAKGLVGDI